MELTSLGKTFVRDEKANDDAAEPGLVDTDSPLEWIGLTSSPCAVWKLNYHILRLAMTCRFAVLQENEASRDCVSATLMRLGEHD